LACRPKTLTLTGALVVLLGIALIVTAVTVASTSTTTRSSAPVTPPSQVNDAGVPLNASRPVDPVSDGDRECEVELGDVDAYVAAAGAAEEALLGSAVTSFSSEQVAMALNQTANLLLGVVFWSPSSPALPASDTLTEDVATQMQVLNGAFAVAGVGFRLDGVVPLNATDDEMKQCASLDKGLPALLHQHLAADDAVVHVLLCEPEGVNGETPVLGGKGGDGATAAVVVVRRNVVWRSTTSLVHQVGNTRSASLSPYLQST
jgi:hypothetical protein